MRRFALGPLIVIACANGPPPLRSAHVVLPPPAPSQVAHVEPIPEDIAQAYALGFTWWTAHREDDAVRAFRVVVDRLLETRTIRVNMRTPKTEPGTSVTPVREGDHVVLATEDGLLIAGLTGKLERFVALPNAFSVRALGSGLVVVQRGDDFVLFDVTTASVVETIAGASALDEAAGRVAIFGSTPSGFVDVWDVASRKRLRTLRDPSLNMVYSVLFALGGRVIVADDMTRAVAWDLDSGERLIAYAHAPSIFSPPAFSSDGRFIAYGTADMTATPVVGTTSLFDRGTKKVIATSHASHFPSGCAFAGKWLAVGDLRRACVLAAPQMTTVACSAEVRPSAGLDDDLQDAHPTFVAGGSVLAIETSDGSMLLARMPTLATIWKGRAHLAVAGDDAYLVDEDNHTLYELVLGVPTRVRALGELESSDTLRETHPARAEDDAAIARVNAETCHVGGTVFPRAACDHNHVTDGAGGGSRRP